MPDNPFDKYFQNPAPAAPSEPAGGSNPFDKYFSTPASPSAPQASQGEESSIAPTPSNPDEPWYHKAWDWATTPVYDFTQWGTTEGAPDWLKGTETGAEKLASGFAIPLTGILTLATLPFGGEGGLLSGAGEGLVESAGADVLRSAGGMEAADIANVIKGERAALAEVSRMKDTEPLVQNLLKNMKLNDPEELNLFEEARAKTGVPFDQFTTRAGKEALAKAGYENDELKTLAKVSRELQTREFEAFGKGGALSHQIEPFLDETVEGMRNESAADLFNKARETGIATTDFDKEEAQDMLKTMGGFNDKQIEVLGDAAHKIKEASADNFGMIRQAVEKEIGEEGANAWEKGQQILKREGMTSADLLGGNIAERGLYQTLRRVLPTASPKTLAATSKGAITLMNAGFSYQMLDNAARMSPRFLDALQQGDYEKAAEYGVEAAGSGLFGIAGASHFLHNAGEITAPLLNPDSVFRPSDHVIGAKRMLNLVDQAGEEAKARGGLTVEELQNDLGHTRPGPLGLSETEKSQRGQELADAFLEHQHGINRDRAATYENVLNAVLGRESEAPKSAEGTPTEPGSKPEESLPVRTELGNPATAGKNPFNGKDVVFRQDVRTPQQIEADRIAYDRKLITAQKNSQDENMSSAQHEVFGDGSRFAFMMNPEASILHRQVLGQFEKANPATGENEPAFGSAHNWWEGAFHNAEISQQIIGKFQEYAQKLREGGFDDLADKAESYAKGLDSSRGKSGGIVMARSGTHPATIREEWAHQWAIDHGFLSNPAILKIQDNSQFSKAIAELKKQKYGVTGDYWARKVELANELFAKAYAGDPDLGLTKAQQQLITRSYLDIMKKVKPEAFRDMPAPDENVKGVVDEYGGTHGGTKEEAGRNLEQGVHPRSVEGNPQGDSVLRKELSGSQREGAADNRGGQGETEAFKRSLAPEEEPWYYLKSEKLVQDKMRGPMPAEDVAKMLRNNGVRDDEMKWTGLDDFLKDKKKVTPEEIRQHLAENAIRVEEVQRGGTKGIPPAIDIETAKNLLANGEPVYGRKIRSGLVATESSTGLIGKELGRYLIQGAKDGHLTLHKGEPRDLRNLATKHGSHVEPGGENYRELLLTMPRQAYTTGDIARDVFGKDISELTDTERDRLPELMRKAEGLKSTTKDFKSGHWDEPNILSHVRMNDRVGPNGEKLLHLEELQSDWHQKGRKEGYRQEIKTPEDAKRYFGISDEDWASASEEHRQQYFQEAKEMYPTKEGQRGLVPDAPFKTDWHEMALRRMLKYAVDNGYDGVSWTPGEAQADRYSLAKQVKEVRYHPETKLLVAKDPNGYEVLSRKAEPKELPDIIGKEAAQKLLDQPLSGSAHVLRGEGLRVGGSGMKGFYDKIVPDYLNKFGKKFGARVGETKLGIPPKLGHETYVYEGPALSKANVYEYSTDQKNDATLQRQARQIWLRMHEDGESFQEAMQKEGSPSLAHSMGGNLRIEKPETAKSFPYLPVTDAMRDSLAREGVSLFKRAEDPRRVYHVSPKELEETDPKFAGTGVRGAERERADRVPATYFYEDEHAHEPMVTGRPNAKKYFATVDYNKIYDLGKDKEGLAKNLSGSALEKAIQDRGYSGYRNDGIVASFDKVKVQPHKEGPSGAINIESMPGKKFRDQVPGIESWSQHKQESYHDEKARVVADAVRKHGIEVSDRKQGLGYWAEESNPVDGLRIGGGPKQVIKASEIAHAVLGDQEAVGRTESTERTTDPKQGNEIKFTFGRPRTREDAVKIGKALDEAGLPAFPDMTDPSHVRIINYDWKNLPDEDKTAYHQAVMDLVSRTFPGEKPRMSMAKTLTDLTSNHDSVDENSPVISAARQAVQEINQRYSVPEESGVLFKKSRFAPTWKTASRYLLPEERERYDTDEKKQRFVEAVNMMPDPKEWDAAVKAGTTGRLWYERSSRAFDALMDLQPDMFRSGDREKFLNFVSALSPVQTVRNNLSMAVNLWSKWNDAGRPTDVTWEDAKNNKGIANKNAKLYRILKGGKTTGGVALPSRMSNAIRALQDQPMSGPKVKAFGPNLGENVDKSTNDTWMAVFGNTDPNTINQPHLYDAMTAHVRMAAEKNDINTRQAQAAVWSFIKTLAELSGWGNDRWIPPQEILKQGLLTPDIVNRYAYDFADLLKTDPEIRAKIKSIGGNLEELDRKLADYVPERPAEGTAKVSTEHLAGAAQRLEAARESKTAQHLAAKSDQGGLFDSSFEPSTLYKRTTETPEFKTWFGDSKVVDEKGEPKVVYHGSKNGDIEIFKAPSYFSDNSSEADAYSGIHDAMRAKKYGRLYPEVELPRGYKEGDLVVEARSDFDLDREDRESLEGKIFSVGDVLATYQGGKLRYVKGFHSADNGKWGDEYAEHVTRGDSEHLSENKKEAAAKIQSLGGGKSGATYPVYLNIKNPKILSWSEGNIFADRWGPETKEKAEKLIEKYKKEGHDGIKTDSDAAALATAMGENVGEVTNWIPFRPEQIKSAIGNRGTFDPNNPNILYKRPVNGNELDNLLYDTHPDGTRTVKDGLPENIKDIIERSKIQDRAKTDPEYVDRYMSALHKVANNQVDPKIKAVVDKIRAHESENWELAHSKGLLQNYIDNHLRRIYKDDPNQDKVLQTKAGQGRYSTNINAARQRVFDNEIEAFLLGKKMELDPIKATVADRVNIIKAAANREFLDNAMSGFMRGSDGRPMFIRNGRGSVLQGDDGENPLVRVNPDNVKPIQIPDSHLQKMQKEGSLDRYLNDGTVKDATPYIHPNNLPLRIKFWQSKVAHLTDPARLEEAVTHLEKLEKIAGEVDHPTKDQLMQEYNQGLKKAYVWDPNDYRSLSNKAFKGWNFMTTGPDGTPVQALTDVKVHPEVADYIKNRLGLGDEVGPSNTTIGKAALKFGTGMKKTLLSMSPFHMVQEGLRALTVGINPFSLGSIDLEKGLKVDPADPKSDTVLKATARQGASYAPDYTDEDHHSEGLAAGHVALINKIPLIGKPLANSMNWYEDFLFKRYIPHLKATAAEKLWGDYKSANPDWSNEKTARAVANHVNNMFGGINWRQMGRSAATQDWARILTLAPDWLESELRSTAAMFGNENGVHRNQILRSALVLWGTARILNYLGTGNAHYEAPFSYAYKDKEGKEILFGIRTLPTDMLHLASDPVGFMKGRMSPTLRTAGELVSQRDQYGRKLEPRDLWVDLLEKNAPIPLQQIGQAVTSTGPEVGNPGQLWKAGGGTAQTYMTPAQQKAADLAATHTEDGALDPAQMRRHRTILGWEDKLRAGEIGWQDVSRMHDMSQISTQEFSRIQKNFKETKGMDPSMAKLYTRAARLPAPQYFEVYEQMGEKEKEALRPLTDQVIRKYMTKQRKNLTPAELMQDPLYQRLSRYRAKQIEYEMNQP